MAKKKVKFEQLLSRLDEINDILDQGDTELEDALALFEEGVGLVRDGNSRLDEAETRLELLRTDGDIEPLQVE